MCANPASPLGENDFFRNQTGKLGTNISKIHGAVLSAWGFAGRAGNQAAILVSDRLGVGYLGVVTMLVVFYSLNFLNVVTLKRTLARMA